MIGGERQSPTLKLRSRPLSGPIVLGIHAAQSHHVGREGSFFATLALGFGFWAGFNHQPLRTVRLLTRSRPSPISCFATRD